MTRNAYVALFYYLDIISISKPIYFYIFWKVCSDVIFESWYQLKSYYGLNLKNVWMQKSFCLVIFTKGDLQIQMIWIQQAWIKNFSRCLTKLVSCILVQWIELGWFWNIGTELGLNENGKIQIQTSGLRGERKWAGQLRTTLTRAG